MRRLILAAAAVAALSYSAIAQERTPNQGTPGPLRAWPATGAWQVVLTRLIYGDLGCLLATGHSNQASGENYAWGVRRRGQSLGATITDNNAQAIAGSAIQIIIDHVPLGIFQITDRRELGNGFHVAVAELASKDGSNLINLIGVGGSMQFVTSTYTYSAPLEGAQQALRNLQTCAIEADHLNAAHPTERQ
jgi:hypothetical protein